MRQHWSARFRVVTLSRRGRLKCRHGGAGGENAWALLALSAAGHALLLEKAREVQNETTCVPSETNPSAPENPAPAPGPPASASAPDQEPAGASGVLATPRPAGPDIAGEDWSLPEHRGGALS